MTQTSSAGAGQRGEPGPLADEAARLVEALSEWARGHMHDGAAGAAAAAAGMGASAECTLCPICQLLGVLRSTKPETFTHLMEASTALTAALRSMVDTVERGGRRDGGVERIRLDDDGPAL